MPEKTESPNEQKVTKHRTTPIKESLTSVPNYPTKLTLYKSESSLYWWVRYYAAHKVFRRSTKTLDKRVAFEFAKNFYDDINFKTHQGTLSGREDNFEVCARAVIAQQEFQVKRNEMSAEMAQADKYRLEKEVLPFFRLLSVKDIDFFKLQEFMNKLTDDKLHGSTISNYMGLVSKTLKFAHRRGLIGALPQIPKPEKVDSARGWFTANEYRLLRRRARRLGGKTYELRKRINSEGVEEIFSVERLLPTQAERAEMRRNGVPIKKLNKAEREYQAVAAASQSVKRVDISTDMYELIVFMTNSFIRPTDLKWMQHKHVEEITNGINVYLRLRIPTSKKHDKPIVTMTTAARVYRRLQEKHKELGYGKSEDYVFMPELFAKKPEDNIKQRDKALVMMQRQFSVILADASLERGPNNEARTLYSLRHTCIMFRLLYGEGMDLLTLARNARTSTEMIDRFYASHLEGEQNIEMIQSRRKRKTTTTEEQIENAIAALTDEKLTAILEQRLQSKKDIVVAEASVTKPKIRKIKRAKTDDMDN